MKVFCPVEPSREEASEPQATTPWNLVTQDELGAENRFEIENHVQANLLLLIAMPRVAA